MSVDLGLHLLELIVTLLVALIGSASFWAIINRKTTNRDLTKRLLLGLAHDRIVYLCLVYISRGFISQDEYENLAVYLFRPYIDFGGNGAVIRLMAEVDKLPIKNVTRSSDVLSDNNLKGQKNHDHG